MRAQLRRGDEGVTTLAHAYLPIAEERSRRFILHLDGTQDVPGLTNARGEEPGEVARLLAWARDQALLLERVPVVPRREKP